MSRAIAAALLVAALAPACGSDHHQTATVVLFDVSASTRSADVRARYERTFDLVLNDVEQQGGVLGADVIDDNPLAHGDLPVNETFDGCGLLDNGLDCRNAADDQRARAEQQANDILADHTLGTDVFGALELAEQFFAAYPQADVRRIVVLSDMVQRGRGLRFPSIADWSPASVNQMVQHAPSVSLGGTEIYVVGMGATTSESLSARQIDGIERFWTSFLERSGADIAFFGASLAAYPIETTA
jgi:hypothetical protein